MDERIQTFRRDDFVTWLPVWDRKDGESVDSIAWESPMSVRSGSRRVWIDCRSERCRCRCHPGIHSWRKCFNTLNIRSTDVEIRKHPWTRNSVFSKSVFLLSSTDNKTFDAKERIQLGSLRKLTESFPIRMKLKRELEWAGTLNRIESPMSVPKLSRKNMFVSDARRPCKEVSVEWKTLARTRRSQNTIDSLIDWSASAWRIR